MVVLQTSQPESPLIRQVIAHDYEGMYNMQLSERKAFSYPPYTRLIYIYLKHRDETLLQELSVRYTSLLREELSASMPKVKEILKQVYENMLVDDRFKTLLLYYDVDPM